MEDIWQALNDFVVQLDGYVFVAAAFSVGLIVFCLLNMKEVTIPGPYEYPIVYNMPQLWPIRSRMLDALMGYAKQYNWSVFTFRLPLTPRYIVVLSPENVRYILQDNFKNYPKGKEFQAMLGELLGDGIFNADGKLWERQRKESLHMFSTLMMREVMQPTFQKHLQTACSGFDRAARTGEVVNFFDFANRFTLDSIGEIGFGKDIKSLAMPDHPFASAFDGVQTLLEERFFNPLWRLTEWIDGSRSKIRKQVAFLDSFCLELIKEKRDSGAYLDQKDVLSRFMQLKDKQGKPLVLNDDKFLRDLVLNYLIAGRDTSAQALSWIAYCLAQAPRVLAKMRAEFDAMYAKREEEGGSANAHSGEQSGPGALTPTYYEVRKDLSYTTDVIRETLRLFPSVPKDVKCAANDDVLPDGTRIPKGSFVVYAPYAMGRWKALWGQDADVFRPERWAERRAADEAATEAQKQSRIAHAGSERQNEGEGEAHAHAHATGEGDGKEDQQNLAGKQSVSGASCPVSGAGSSAKVASGCPMSGNNGSNGVSTLPRMSDYVYPVFNAGKRSCLGKEMALLEISTILATLYHRYDFEALHCGGEPIASAPEKSSSASDGEKLDGPMIGNRTDIPYASSLTMPQAEGGLHIKISLRRKAQS